MDGHCRASVYNPWFVSIEVGFSARLIMLIALHGHVPLLRHIQIDPIKLTSTPVINILVRSFM